MSQPTIPKHCPGCGAAFPGRIVIELQSGVATGRLEKPADGHKSMVDRQPLVGGSWDCWCPSCNWSGDISPDH